MQTKLLSLQKPEGKKSTNKIVDHVNTDEGKKSKPPLEHGTWWKGKTVRMERWINHMISWWEWESPTRSCESCLSDERRRLRRRVTSLVDVDTTWQFDRRIAEHFVLKSQMYHGFMVFNLKIFWMQCWLLWRSIFSRRFQTRTFQTEKDFVFYYLFGLFLRLKDLPPVAQVRF